MFRPLSLEIVAPMST